jgi:hypothetical protein
MSPCPELVGFQAATRHPNSIPMLVGASAKKADYRLNEIQQPENRNL